MLGALFLSRYLSLAHIQLDADVATTILDYDYYILIGMVGAQYYQCPAFP